MQSSNDHHQRWRARRTFALLVGLLTTIVTFVSPSPTAFAGDGTLTLTKSIEGGATNFPSGQPITYRLTYSCDANGSAPPITCDGATLVDTIPTFVDIDGATQRLEYLSSQGSIDTDGNGVHDPVAGTVTFTFDADFDAGSSGFVLVTLRPPFHEVPDATVVRNEAALQLNGQSVQSSIDATVNARTVLVTTKGGPTSAGVGTNVSYNISACVEAGLGRLPADDVIVVDTIPVGAIVVSTIPTATVTGNTVQWNIGRVEPGIPVNCRPLAVTLAYPNGPFSGGQVVVNQETMSGQQPGSPTPPTPVSASAPTTLIAGDRIVTLKTADVTSATTGDQINWRLAFESNGSDPLSGVTITDAVPPEVRVIAIDTADNPSAAPVTVEYSVDAGATYIVIPGSPFPGAANQRIDVAPLLTAGQFITNVRFSYGAVPAFWNTYPTIESVVINPDRNGLAYGSKIVTNCVASTYASPTTPNGVRPSSCANVDVSSEPAPSVGLAVPSTATRGTVIDGVVFVENFTPATAGLVQPVVSMVVPAGLSFVAGSTAWDPISTGMPAPDIVEIVPNWDGSADSLVRWRWSTPVTLPRSTAGLIRFRLNVDPSAAAGVRTFRTTVSNQSPQPGFSACNPGRTNNYVTSDPFDRDGDGVTTDQLCESLTTISIAAAAGLDSRKQVQGELDPGFTAIGSTTPGGRANYRLTVENSGTQTIAPGATFIDILPAVGDTLVASTTPRGSEWSPYLVDEIQGSTATVEYSTAANPCRGEVGGPVTGCTAPNWTTWNATLAANPTVIHSLRFTFPAALNPGASHVFTWEMRVPLDLSLIGQRAYNSFAYYAQPALGGPPLVSEPPKVELLIAAPPGGGQIGDYTWNDLDQDGTQGVNEPPIQGTLVELWTVGADGIRGSADDGKVAFTRTDSQGLYLFQNVPGGRFYIRFVGIPNMTITTQDSGGDDELDSDAEAGSGPTAGWTDAFDFCDGTATCNDRTRDAGFFSSSGSLTVTKNVTGPAKPLLSAAQFTVHYDCGNGVVGDLVLLDGEQGSVDSIDPGSSCTLTEVPPAPVAGVTFGTPTFSPASPIIIVGGGAPAVAVTLTNPTTLTAGGFTITKTVTGPASSLVPAGTVFTADYNCGPGATGTVTFTRTTTGSVNGLAAGAICTLIERTPPAITGVVWGTPTIAPNPITIAPAGNTAVAITNPTILAPGGFTITKTVNGPAATLVPAGTIFTADYNCGTSATGTVTFTRTTTGVVSGIAAGAICTLIERTPPAITGVVWGTPTIAPNPITIAPAGNTAVAITNPTTLASGSFTVSKRVVGATNLVPGNTAYTIDYNCSNGTTGTTTITIASPSTITGLPAATTCTLTETPPTIPGVVWGTPVITPNPITINPGATALVEVTNTAGPAAGSFTISKIVTGPGAPLVPAGTTYTIHYDCGNGNTADLAIEDLDTASVSGIPAGSTCTITELPPTPVTGVIYNTPTITPTTFTLQPGAAVTITVTNPTTLAPGGFTITKTVNGPAATLVPAGTIFTADYNCGTSATGTVTFTRTTTGVVSGIAAGAICTLIERTPPAITGVVWGTPTIAPNPITIAPAGNTAVVITNPTTLSPGSFTISKAVSGAASTLVPAGTVFQVDYNCGAGSTGTVDVTLGAATPATVTGVPAGANCALIERTPPVIPGVVWGTPAFNPASPVLIPGGATTAVALTVTNPTTLASGSFTVSKRVVGATNLVPGNTAYTIDYNCSNGTTGTTTITIASPSTITGLPAATTCTLTETPPTIPGVVWGTPVITPNPITINPGATALVEVTNTAGPAAGSFTISKIVTGPGAPLVPAGTTYTIHYDCGNGNTADLAIEDLDTASVSGIPAGSTCTITELPPTPVTGVIYNTPTITPTTFTLQPGAAVTITVTNPTTLAPGGFTITKTVNGPAATLVPAGTIFTADYNCGTSATGTVDITLGAAAPAFVTGIPAGSSCTVIERTPPAITGVVWGTPVLTPTSPITIVGGATATVDLVLTNPTSLAAGSLTITKAVTGPASTLVPNGTVFTVDYDCGAGATGSIDVTLGAATPATVTGIPAGANCALTERTPPVIPGVVWGTPAFNPASPVLIPGGATATVDITLTNPTILTDGGFTITKTLSGAAAATIDPATRFTITWTCTGGITGTVALPVGVVHTVDQIPAGSDCTVDEATPATQQGTRWAAPVITPPTFRVDGGVATAVAVTVENIAEVSRGGFSVTKSLTGTGAALIPATTEFEVEWTCDDGTLGSFRLTRGTTTMIDNVTAGSTCTLTESTPPAVEGVRWDAPTFSPSATVTVAGGSTPTVAVDLVNTASSLPGGFTITKRVTGGAAAAIDATWNFTVFYACSDGTNGSLTLQRETSATVSGRDAGTTCRLSEAPLELRDGLQWSAPIFAPGAEFAIVADHNVDIVLTNPVEQSSSVPVNPTRPGSPNTPPNPNRPIPVTGTDVQGWLAIGLALVMLGAGILIVTRRRTGPAVRP